MSCYRQRESYTVADRVVNMKQVRELLQGLGLSYREAPERRCVVFESKEHGLVILLPLQEDSTPVWEPNLVGIRRHLDEHGILPAPEFDRLLEGAGSGKVSVA